jgi:hypothetical protein
VFQPTRCTLPLLARRYLWLPWIIANPTT